MCKIYSAIVLLLFSFCIYACYNIRRKLSVQYFLFIFGITFKPKQLVCGILCNRDNCKRGPRSRVGPGPPTCLIRPWCFLWFVAHDSTFRHLVLEGGICHFVKLQIPHLKSKGLQDFITYIYIFGVFGKK